jgi:hypothetical protein
MRHTEAAVLREMAGLDKQAVAEIQLALQAEGVSEKPPQFASEFGDTIRITAQPRLFIGLLGPSN